MIERRPTIPHSGKYVTSGATAPLGFTLAKGQTEVFEVTATSSRNLYLGVLDVEIDIASHLGVISVQKQSRPFATSG